MRNLTLIVVVAACAGGGCIERELAINSDPAGATVEISGVEVGTTPMRKSFTWYGVYDIVLRKDGYETLMVAENIAAPAHQVPPLDFFVEIWPGTVYDRRQLQYTLQPLKLPDRQTLIDRADALKKRNDEKVARPRLVTPE
jgi:hypothetical protein